MECYGNVINKLISESQVLGGSSPKCFGREVRLVGSSASNASPLRPARPAGCSACASQVEAAVGCGHSNHRIERLADDPPVKSHDMETPPCLNI